MKEEAAAATARCGHLTTERDALVSSLEEAKAQSASLQSKLASMTTQREALAGRVAAAAQELQVSGCWCVRLSDTVIELVCSCDCPRC